MNETFDLPNVGKKYQSISEDAIRRVYAKERMKRGSAKEAEKATRAALHQMSGAFLSADELKRAHDALRDYQAGDVLALPRLFSLHASMRERLPEIDALYERIFRKTGLPKTVLDLACGMNPIYLGNRGLDVTGLDVHGEAVRLVNEAARLCRLPIRAECADLVGKEDFPRCELALMMKLLPLMETQEKGASLRLLSALPPGNLVVTFPTRSLGGRNVGMEAHYQTWFEALLGQENCADIRCLERFTMGSELVYILFKER